MEYRAVLKRCAISLEALHVPIVKEEILTILSKKGFKVVEVDIIALARGCIGTATWRRGAKISEAPAVLDCSSFIKWLYGERGIWLPRRAIQQRGLGEEVSLDEVIAGDLIFNSGFIDRYHTDPADGVGHVGIATGEGTVIHAANKKIMVTESSLESFTDKNVFRGIRRYIPKKEEVITLEVPQGMEIEIADDIRWILLQSITM